MSVSEQHSSCLTYQLVKWLDLSTQLMSMHASTAHALSSPLSLRHTELAPCGTLCFADRSLHEAAGHAARVSSAWPHGPCVLYLRLAGWASSTVVQMVLRYEGPATIASKHDCAQNQHTCCLLCTAPAHLKCSSEAGAATGQSAGGAMGSSCGACPADPFASS